MTNVEGRKLEGAPERSPKAGEGAASGVDGNVAKRFSVQRKMAVVARMLRGEPLELVARETNVSIAKLSEWRERALAGAATALKERERDDRDDEIARLKSKVGEITMAGPFVTCCRRRTCRDTPVFGPRVCKRDAGIEGGALPDQAVMICAPVPVRYSRTGRTAGSNRADAVRSLDWKIPG
jgi:hypothetical protein